MNDEDQLFGGVDVRPALASLLTKKADKVAAGRKTGGKFNISPKSERTIEGRTFDSKLEMKMYEELMRHFSPEEVRTQVRFILQPSYCLDGEKDLQRALVYKADFVLGPLAGTAERPEPGVGSMVLDAKGMVLSSFVVASKLFEYKWRMPVIAVKSVKQLKGYIEQFKMTQQANQEYVSILTSGRPFVVRGYVNSSGEKADLTVEVIGRNGYLDLVRRSKNELDAWEVYPEKGESEPYRISDSAADPSGGLLVPGNELQIAQEAVTKVKDSLTKKLGEGGEEEGAVRRESKETFTPLSPDVGIINGDPTQLAVMRLRIISREVQGGAEPSEAPFKQKKSSSTTVWRKKIEDRLPVGQYCHRLNLYPGKFDSLEPV